MAKPLVLRPDEKDPVPFLRGILTRSLTEAGLSFEQAYLVSSKVRATLQGKLQVSTDDIRRAVVEHLQPYGKTVQRRYELRRASAPAILVRHPDGHKTTFSRGRHRVALAPCGVDAEAAGRVVTRLLDKLTQRGKPEVTARELSVLTWEAIRSTVGEEPARRYLVWEEYIHSERPLLVLVGGATGAGKSTIATELSHHLGILRVQSTDMLREVMRTMISERLLPVLHRSSFLSWQAFAPEPPADEKAAEQLFVEGFLNQVELLAVASEAVLERAIHERVSMILEGVHVHPSLLARMPPQSDAIVVPVMLGVLSTSELKRRIQGRGKRVPGRRAKRYLEHFDAIWRLQGFLLAEADRTGMPIVANEDVEAAVTEVLGLILAELSKHFAGAPEKAFG